MRARKILQSCLGGDERGKDFMFSPAGGRRTRTCLHVLHGCVEGVEAEFGLELGVLLPPRLPGGEVLAARIRRLRRQ